MTAVTKADIVERLRFDAARCELQFSKGVAGNIEEAAGEIERLRKLARAPQAAAEIERLREVLREVASQCHNLPRSATADRIERIARDALGENP